MNLYKEILVKMLESKKAEVVFPDLEINAAEIVNLECYRALQKIKAVIQDDSLNDKECFMKIEKIICLFEELGSSGGSRHDFG